MNRQAWKSSHVPAYFDSEWGKKFLQTLNGNGTDMASNETNNNNSIHNRSINNFNEDKENNFLQTSENDFMPNNKSSVEILSSSRIGILQNISKGNFKMTNKKRIIVFSRRTANDVK
jgi:hypothetical protein